MSTIPPGRSFCQQHCSDYGVCFRLKLTTIAIVHSYFGNETLLRGAALLTGALKAVTEPTHQARIAYDLMHLQYVLLVRWDSLRLNATATKTPWPVHDTKAEEFQAFVTAYNASGIQTGFTEVRKYPPRCHGASPCWTTMKMTLASFHAELFGN